MHEMSLAEGVLQLIEDAARQQNFEKVVTVWLEIGQLSGAEAVT
jgi:hydrogenase nickel incorporation protein HypA/HybF